MMVLASKEKSEIEKWGRESESSGPSPAGLRTPAPFTGWTKHWGSEERSTGRPFLAPRASRCRTKTASNRNPQFTQQFPGDHCLFVMICSRGQDVNLCMEAS